MYSFTLPEINYLAVLISAIAMMVIGSIWYGPLFGKLWMQGIGIDPNDTVRIEAMKKSTGSAYVLMFIGALFTSYVFSYFFGTWASGTGWDQAISGLYYGFLAWLGFALPIVYAKRLWEGKEFKYIAIDLGYYLLSLLVIGVIIATFVKMDLDNDFIPSEVPYSDSQSVELDRQIKSAVSEKVDSATKGVWDYNFDISSVDLSQKAAVGLYQAKDWWDWFAWQDQSGTWNVLVSLDGWDCTELDKIPKEYQEFFDSNTTSLPQNTTGERYCYDH